jgi:type II secretory pathway component GspD/PulD (secretin)
VELIRFLGLVFAIAGIATFDAAKVYAQYEEDPPQNNPPAQAGGVATLEVRPAPANANSNQNPGIGTVTSITKNPDGTETVVQVNQPAGSPQGNNPNVPPGNPPGQPGQTGQPGQPGGNPPNARPRDNLWSTNRGNPNIAADFNMSQEQRTHKINFRGAVWRDVIEWYAAQAGLSLELESAPPGSFTFQDDKTYTTDGVLNLLNSYLLRRGFTLIRNGRLLMLVNLQDGIPIDVVRDVTESELDNVMDYEVVRVVFNLTAITPDVMQAEIQPMLGSQGHILTLVKSQQIAVTEFGNKLRAIRMIIRNLDSPAIASGSMQLVELHNVPAEMAVTTMKQLMPLSDNDINLRVVVDASGSKVWLSGRRDMVERARTMLQELDGGTVDPSELRVQVYPINSADPNTVLSVAQTLLAGRPDVRLSLDSNTKALIVRGRNDDHIKIIDTIKQLEEVGYSIVGIQLTKLSATKAKETIDNFFSNTSPSSSSSIRSPFSPQPSFSSSNTGNAVPAPIVKADTMLKQLIVKGTKSQIEQIKSILAMMGETNFDTGGVVRNMGTDMRSIPMTAEQGQIVLQLASNIWPQMGGSELKIVTPSNLHSVLDNNQSVQPTLPQTLQRTENNILPTNTAIPPTTQSGTTTGTNPTTNNVSTDLRNFSFPQERFHVIDGFADEPNPSAQPNNTRNDNGNDNLAPQTPAPDTAVPDSNTPTPAVPNNLNEPTTDINIDTKLDELFGPQQNSPDKEHLSTQRNTISNVQYTPVVYRQQTEQNAETESTATAAAMENSATQTLQNAMTDVQNASVPNSPAATLPPEQSPQPPPIAVSVGPGGIWIAGHPDELDRFEELLRTLSNDAILQTQTTEFYAIKNAKADTLKSLLSSILGYSSSSSSVSSSDATLGGSSDPLVAYVSNALGGTKIQATGSYEIIVEPQANMLIINANKVDHLTIQKLLPILDRIAKNDDVLIRSKPHFIVLANMRAEDAQTIVQSVFTENLQNNSGNGGNNASRSGSNQRGDGSSRTPGGFAAAYGDGPPTPGGGMMLGGGNPGDFIRQIIESRNGGSRSQQQVAQVEVEKMTLAVEASTNSLIVYAPESLFLRVEEFVKQLDELAKNNEPRSTVVSAPDVPAQLIQNYLKAMKTGNAITVTNNTTVGANSNNRNNANRGTTGFGGGFPTGGFGGGRMPDGFPGGGFPGGGFIPGGMMGNGMRR